MDVKAQFHEVLKYNKILTYLPYGHPDTLCPDGVRWKQQAAGEAWFEWSNKPWQWDFHAAGKDNVERMQMCANRVGKTEGGCAEVTYHLTGQYPDWWVGHRYEKPILVWTGSPTNESSRNILQQKLLGGTGKLQLGTGFIPKVELHGRPKMRQCGVSNVVEMFQVRHYGPDGRFDGYSQIEMKSYEQGWRKFQGTEPDLILLDEEPEDYMIYTECQTRLLTSRGLMMVTFTPLLGQTDLVMHFQEAKAEGIWCGTAGWDDVPHLSKAEKDRQAASYPAHEVEARRFGVPMMGEGRIFTEPEESIVVQPFVIPNHWARICGIDFGIGHPAAAAWLAWDRDSDVMFLYDVWRDRKEYPIHCSAIKRRGEYIPVSWPHDGGNRDKSGKELKDLYRQEGVNMLSRSARYDNNKGGAQPQWPVIEEIRNRESTGRIKVFSTCGLYLEERRNYHTKDGKIVDRMDDALKAAFYGVMMKRYAMSNMRVSRTTRMMPLAR